MLLHVLPLSPAVVAAGLAWMAALWMTPRYLRHRSDIRLSLYWRTVALFALSLTFVVPAIYGAVDRLTGMPNVARWVCNALVLTSVYLFDTFYFSLAHASDRLRWHRPWLLGCLVLALAAMALLLWRTDLPADPLTLDLSQIQPAVVAYRLIFLSACGFFVVRVILHAAHYLRDTPHPLVKANMTLLIAAGIWGLGYLGCTSASVLIPLASPLAQVIQYGAQLSLFVAVLLLALSITVPGWGRRLGLPAVARHMRVLVTYQRLGPLWRRLTQARPQAVLPMTITWPSALWHPQHMELLLHRRVIEILDARWLLLTGAPCAEKREGLPSGAGMPQKFMRLGESTRSNGVSISPPPVSTLPERTRRRAIAHDSPGQRGRTNASDNGARLDRERIEQLARAEATHLALHLCGSARGDSALQPGIEVYQPSTCGEAVRYLERVAAALKTADRNRHSVGGSRRTQPAGIDQG